MVDHVTPTFDHKRSPTFSHFGLTFIISLCPLGRFLIPECYGIIRPAGGDYRSFFFAIQEGFFPALW